MKIVCDECNQRVEVTPGDVIEPGSPTRWWRFVLHAVGLDGVICRGSNSNVSLRRWRGR